MLKKWIEKILNGGALNKEEALSLYEVPLNELLEGTKVIFNHFNDKEFDFCTIINGKKGKCSEDCQYCAQSAHHECAIDTYGLLSLETIVKDAKRNACRGIEKYSIVTSGKRASKEEIATLCQTYAAIDKEVPLSLCASHGLIDEEDLIKLKNAGVKRIHNNLETSRNYFEKICTTHSYDEKIATIKAAQDIGLEVCSGGIIGLGETREDRIDMAFELKTLGIKSIPLNLLNPIEGTPLYGIGGVDEEEFYKTCAIYRLIHPKVLIRLAGGRGLLSDKGKRVFETCLNGAITGELLTTTGNDTENDMKMIKALGLRIRREKEA